MGRCGVGYNLYNWVYSEANPTISIAGEQSSMENSKVGMFSIKAVYSTMKFKNHLHNDSALFVCSVPVCYVYVNEILIHVRLSSKVYLTSLNLFVFVDHPYRLHVSC